MANRAPRQDQDDVDIFEGELMRIVEGHKYYGRVGRVEGYHGHDGVKLALMYVREKPTDEWRATGKTIFIGSKRMVHDAAPPPAPRQFKHKAPPRLENRIPGDVPADAEPKTPPRRRVLVEEIEDGQTIADAAAAAGTGTPTPTPTQGRLTTAVPLVQPVFTDAPEPRVVAPGVDLAPLCAFVTETPYGRSTPTKFEMAPRALATVPVVAQLYGYGQQVVTMGGLVRATVAPGEGAAKLKHTQYLVELDDGTYRLFTLGQLSFRDIPQEIIALVAPSRAQLYVMQDLCRPPGRVESKIGMASNPETACMQMRRGNPHVELYAQHVAQDAVRSERLAHHLCSKYRVNEDNEWFYMEPAHAELMVRRAIELVNAALALKSFP